MAAAVVDLEKEAAVRRVRCANPLVVKLRGVIGPTINKQEEEYVEAGAEVPPPPLKRVSIGELAIFVPRLLLV